MVSRPCTSFSRCFLLLSLPLEGTLSLGMEHLCSKFLKRRGSPEKKMEDRGLRLGFNALQSTKRNSGETRQTESTGTHPVNKLWVPPPRERAQLPHPPSPPSAQPSVSPADLGPECLVAASDISELLANSDLLSNLKAIGLRHLSVTTPNAFLPRSPTETGWKERRRKPYSQEEVHCA